MTPHYLSRAEWGARDPRPMTAQQPPREAFVHYSDGDQGDVKAMTRSRFAQAVASIQHFHMEDRGWSDIGYHYVVAQISDARRKAGDPEVAEARHTTWVPAAQAGHNTDTLAICVLAGPDDTISEHTRYVVETILKRYPSVKVLGGHRDVTSTDCPGDRLYAAIPRIAKAAGLKTYGK